MGEDDYNYDSITIESDLLTDYSDYTITIPSPSVGYSGTISTSSNDVYISNNNWSSTQASVSVPENGDFKIGDRSLKDFMDKVEERLAILRPDPALESRWEQLKKLGDEYRALEKDIHEKEKIMDILKDKG